MKHLKPTNIQYQIVHDSTTCFKIGEKVFLKSNPSLTLTVISIEDDFVEISWQKDGEILKNPFPPQCLLQYKYAGLIWWKDEEMCLN